MRSKFTPILLSGFAYFLIATPAMAADIRFYAQNGCRGPVIFRYPSDATVSDNCKQSRKRCSRIKRFGAYNRRLDKLARREVARAHERSLIVHIEQTDLRRVFDIHHPGHSPFEPSGVP